MNKRHFVGEPLKINCRSFRDETMKTVSLTGLSLCSHFYHVSHMICSLTFTPAACCVVFVVVLFCLTLALIYNYSLET